MIPTPSTIPYWATQDQIDSVTLQNNVLTPPPEMQNYGWQHLQFPPRNWFNWLGRWTGNWIAYLAQQDSQSVVADGSGLTKVVNNVTGGLVVVWVVDTGDATKFYNGMAYFPPASGSAVTLHTIAGSGLTISTISTAGKITVTGGTGPYIVYTQTKAIP